MIFKSFGYRVKRFFAKTDSQAILYSYESLLIAFVLNFVNNNNNLFATRLGATDLQLSLVSSMPQLASMIVLLPAGILIDSVSNKRKVVIRAIFTCGLMYLLLSMVPFLQTGRLEALILILSFSIGCMTVYNISWQSFFPEVIPIEERNKTLTFRSAISFCVTIVGSLSTGFILSHTSKKVMVHQGLLITAFILIIIQTRVLSKITPRFPSASHNITLKSLKSAAINLVHNKKFLTFTGCALFFHMTWHMDWTLYYIGQIRYLKLNEAFLSYAVVGPAVMQFITIKYWSRINERFGVNFPIVFGILGLACCPLSMIAANSIPAPLNKYMFILFHTLSCSALATINLNFYQCLLQVIDQQNKTLSISLYTILIATSNATMPVVGVKIYQAFGNDLSGLKKAFTLFFCLRIFAAGLWILRVKSEKLLLRPLPKLRLRFPRLR